MKNIARLIAFMFLAQFSVELCATAVTDLSSVPLGEQITAPPNIIIAYDDSGSTANNYLPDAASSLPDYEMYNYHYNPLAYNPNKTYTPWVKSVKTSSTNAVLYPNANYTKYFILTNPVTQSGTLTAGSTYQVTYSCDSSGSNKYSNTYDYDTGLKFTSQTTCQNKSKRIYTMTSSYTIKAGQTWRSGTISSTSSTAIYYDILTAATSASNYLVVPCPSGDLCTGLPPAPYTNYRIVQVTIAPTDTTNLQNYANWQQYYSDRHLMMSSSMSGVLSTLTGVNMGVIPFNNASVSNDTVRDFDATIAAKTYNNTYFASTAANSTTTPTASRMFNLNNPADTNTLLDIMYNLNPTGSTPTHDVLNSTGVAFNTKMTLNTTNDSGVATTSPNGIIQYSCQQNAALVVTDGYANESPLPALPTAVSSYNQTTYGGSAPYSTTYSKSLADIALAFYTTILRAADYTHGQVVGSNPNLHMNTYAITLGVLGQIFGTNTVSANDPYNNPPTWTDPTTATNNIKQIDDLWHATINGRGQMAAATNPSSLVTYLQQMISSIQNLGAASAIALSNVNIQSGDNTAYIAEYFTQGWYGDLLAESINTTTGDSIVPALWSLQAKLAAIPGTTSGTTYTTSRKFASYNNGGVVFPSGLSSTQTASMNTSGNTDNVLVANYIMGDRSNEGASSPSYRQRTYVLGDLVNAEPVPVKEKPTWAITTDTAYQTFATNIANRPTVVYQGSNDGMLHAVNASDGTELWNYIPSFVIPNLSALTSQNYSHQFYVDGTPTVADVRSGGTWTAGTYTADTGSWKTLLVGGLRAGGQGYYAIDVTNPVATSTTNLASKVKWEFPNSSTATYASAVGNSYSQPLLLKTAAGWVVMVSSGYNNTDNYGHILVLNPETGAVLKDMTTGNTESSANPAGLAHLSAYSTDGVNYSVIYAGDLNGNVWKFDVSDTSINNWSTTATKIVTLKDASGNTQPITSAIELGQLSGKPMLYVGTGRYLGASDLNATTSTRIQTVYGIVDDGTVYALSPRNLSPTFVAQTISGTQVSRNTVTYPTNKGWYLDFPAGQRVLTDIQAAFGTLIFNTTYPSVTTCSSASYQYQINQYTGGMMDNSYFATGTTPSAITSLGNIMASRPVVAVLPNGTVISYTHGGDGSLKVTKLLGSGSTTLRKVAWREIRS